MQDIRVIAVSLEGEDSVENITHFWTINGLASARQVFDDVRARRRGYHTVSPLGKIPVIAAMQRKPTVIDRLLRRPIDGHVRSHVAPSKRDSLLLLPRLPSPTRPRRSRIEGQAAA